MDFAVLLGALNGWSGNAAGLTREATHQVFSGHGLVKRMELAGQMLGRYGAFTRGLGETHCFVAGRTLAWFAIA